MRLLPFLTFAITLAAAQAPGDLESKLDTRISAALKKSGAPSVSVAIVRDGKVFYTKAFGKADLAANRAADARTRYAVGSISKQFTAAALLLLQEEGKVSLDDRVAKYFPDLTRANDITIRQLLSHTSGYEDYAPQDYIIPDWTQPSTPLTVVNRWGKRPLNFEPGTKWQYSNTNFVLAALIVEKVSGGSLIEYLRTKIFRPLGMTTATSWPPFDDSDATAYTRFAFGPPRPVKREAAGWYYGAGSLAMTPSDLLKWDLAFLEKRVLSAKSYAEFTREIKLKNGDSTHYALGLRVAELNNMPIYQHGGEVSGFLASNTVFPTRKGAVVVVSNQDCVTMTGPLADEVAKLVFLDAPAAPPESTSADVQKVILGLRQGKIDRALFSSNANTYFTEEALRDCKASLSRLGKLKEVKPVSENLRGGMRHRNYSAEFEKKKLRVSIYLLDDGKYEQFLVEE